jgi:superfamily II DNA or RNA helicase
VKLRNYQTESIAAVIKHWSDGEHRAAVILPTGAGKTVIFSELARHLEAQKLRVVVLVHREELVHQTVAKLKAMGVQSVGIVKAQLNQTWARVVVATVQTLYVERRLEQLGGVDVVICDELHHFAAARNRTLLSRLGVFDGRAMSVGFTATFTRSDNAKLGNDWDVVYERDVQWGIEHGYLSDVEAHSIRVPDLDLSTVKSTAGDFSDNSLGDAMTASSAREVIPQAWRKYADGRPTILFAPNIASCSNLADGCRDAGIKTEVVFGTTRSDERAAVYDRVRNGTTSILASVGVLTEGFDIPAISCAILARPTKSRGLWQQMAGRALRLFPGKDKAVLLDITGDAVNHSLASVTDLSRTRQEAETKPRAVSLCSCSEAPFLLCCTAGETRLECRKRKAEGVCTCNCLCDEDFGEEEITLVRGDHDIEVDLFAGSTTVWLKTMAGVWFIPTQQFTVFVARLTSYPGDGYFVGRTGDNRRMEGGSFLTDEPMDQSAAMMIAQAYAEEHDPQVSRRDAKWRKNKASEAQIGMVASLGYLSREEAAALRRGPVSDLLSIHFASRLLDPRVGTFINP